MTWQYYEFMFSKDSGSRPEPLPDYYKGDYRYKRSNSDEDMKKAYREAILKSHPDRGGDVEEFRMYREAWEDFLL